jgi:hypothetical protein
MSEHVYEFLYGAFGGVVAGMLLTVVYLYATGVLP